VFITMAKEGSTVGGLMDAFGTAISMCLQHGVPVQSLVRKFAHTRFEPSGFTKKDIPMAKSLPDYIFRWFGQTFHDGYKGRPCTRRSSPDRRKAEAVKPAGELHRPRWRVSETAPTG
jgi:ribonucleoside-diphosphate reductase alpha chain